jgi:hypothetical protein
MHIPTDPHTSTAPPTPASASQPIDFAAYQQRLLQLAVAAHLALERGVTDPAVIRDLAEHDPVHVHDCPAGFTWIGPKAFERIAFHYKGIDDDLGMLWGPRHDVRISLRAPSDARTGLLYAFDPTWDEYTVLDGNARTEHAVATFQLATEIDPHMDPARFLQIYQHLRTLEPATPARQPDGIGVQW